MLTTVTQPTEFPISVAEAKAHMRVTQSDDDQLIDGYIRAASEYAQDLIMGGRAFLATTYDWKLPDFPGNCFDIPRPPLSSITSVQFFASDASTLTTLSSTNYFVHLPTMLPGQIELVDGSWPDVDTRKDAVQIQFIAGWGSTQVPERVKQALKMQVNSWYCNRSAVGPNNIVEMDHSVTALLGSLGYGQYN